jgi:hypothetical protein
MEAAAMGATAALYVATGAAAAGAVAHNPGNPMTVYNLYSLQFASNKKYRFLITVTNGLIRIETCYFAGDWLKPRCHSLHRHLFFPKQE